MNREDFENSREDKVFSELQHELKLFELAQEDLEEGRWVPEDEDPYEVIDFVVKEITKRQKQINIIRKEVEESKRPGIAREAESIAERLPETYLRRWIIDEMRESQL